jgi:uncharacterized YigZ family protein
MEAYTTVRQHGTAEIEEKKSVFIGNAAPVESEAEAIAFIEKIRTSMPDARHHVYAYLLRAGNTTRYSDDHEPQGTAGMPVLEVIRKAGCTDTVVVVTRYFGGILLGTGGLCRAYTAAAVAALGAAQIVTRRPLTEIAVECGYSEYQKLLAEFPRMGIMVDGTDFAQNVRVRLAIPCENTSMAVEKMTEICAGRLKTEEIGCRFDIFS